MRIVLLPSAYSPAVGGVEELTARLARRFVDGGDEVEVWTNQHPVDLQAREEIDGIAVRRFPLPLPRLAPGALLGFPFAALRARRTLRGAARDFRPDVLHVQGFSGNGVYAAWLSRRLRVPLVVTLQGETVADAHDIYSQSLTLRVALRRAIRKARAVTGCSRYILSDAERRFGLAPGRGHVIPNGIEPTTGGSPQPLELPFERFVLAAGRMVGTKGFDLLLQAFARIAPRHGDVGLVIAGDGPARLDLERSADTAGLRHRVALPGALSRNEIEWAMANADVFALPSRIEAFGIVVLEALRAGTPVVVSSRGGPHEIVGDDEEYGLVVDPTDVGALAEAIERVLVDSELAYRLSAAGMRRAADFDWESIAMQYRRLYEG